MKKHYYIVEYVNRGENIQDLFNTIETIYLITIARFNKRIEVIKIKKGEFYE